MNISYQQAYELRSRFRFSNVRGFFGAVNRNKQQPDLRSGAYSLQLASDVRRARIDRGCG